jgi:hypothetical protein
MSFDPNAYEGRPADALKILRATDARTLFPNSRAPEAALAGLYLRFGGWNEAHEIAQEIDTPDGAYWHALIHRAEPDESNAAYWFRQVGRHPIFPALAKAAREYGIGDGQSWDPFAFLKISSQGRGAELERVEWQLLFDYCAAEKKS